MREIASAPPRSKRTPASRRSLGPLLLALGLAGALACATTASLKDARGNGLTRTFEGGFEEIFAAAVESLRGLGMEVDRVDEEERWITATRYPGRRGPGAPQNAAVLQSDQGERIGVFVDSVAPGRWRVEVVTVRLFALDPGKLDWGEDVFYSMEVRLDPDTHIRLPDSAVPPR